MQWNRNDQTICAISTPAGHGGLAIIRLSGPQAVKISGRLIKKFSQGAPPTHTAHFAVVYDLQGEKIDEAVATYFAAGKSFTGEDVVEISCHGSVFVTQKILDTLIQAGASAAEKGEFTYRAFMNGRIDLVQAESVLSLIESQSAGAARMALRQLEGRVSQQLGTLISDLTWCLAHIEASIDFIEQGVEVVDNAVLTSKLKNINERLQALIGSFSTGRLVRDGINVTLIGEPNVGKSSLLNLLAQSEKAIVTPLAGTTRDIVEAEVLFEGLKFNISDTAGIRQTEDQIEKIGIERSKKSAATADLVCHVIEGDTAIETYQWPETAAVTAKKMVIINKSDRFEAKLLDVALKALPNEYPRLAVSALEPKDRARLLAFFRDMAGPLNDPGDAVISSVRQVEQARYSFEMISKSIRELEQKTGAEFVAMYLKEALVSLQKILGQVYDDQIMDRVFKEFCLGK